MEPKCFIERLLEASLGRHEQKQQQHQKQNPSEEEMESRGSNAIRVPKKGLDTADFLIDGLTHFAPTALGLAGAIGIP